MAGDIPLHEQVIISEQPDTLVGSMRAARKAHAVLSTHNYGKKVRIVESTQPDLIQKPLPGFFRDAAAASSALGASLDPIELLGISALQLRQSPSYQQGKRQRPKQGQPWDMGGKCVRTLPRGAMARSRAAEPWSAYLEGSVAVGIVIVSGPTPELQFSDEEVLKIVTEVQNGLSWLPSMSAAAEISYTYDIQHVKISTPADPSAPDLEALWRDPAMAALGYAAGWEGVVQYIENNRQNFGTRWTYCGFFTKYPLSWFAYAYLGGPYLVMQYENDGWGPDNIDRVFTHETGHIFNCPDEYGSSYCSCNGMWGRYGAPNSNCENCAPQGGVPCIMKGNSWEMCVHTPLHIGFPVVWQIKQSDACLDLGDIDADGKVEQLVCNKEGGNPWVAMLRGDSGTRGLEVTWAAIQELPGGWKMSQSDVYLDLGDIDGDGKAEVLVRSQEGSPRLALLRYADFINGLQCVWTAEGELPGGWKMNSSDAFLPIGDIDGDGKAEVLVRSQYAGNERWEALLRFDSNTGGLSATWAAKNDLPGQWKMNQSDAYLSIGDVDGDGKAEVLVRSQYEGNERWEALLRFDNHTGGLKATWSVKNELPGQWKMNQSDAYLAIGDIDGDGKAEVLVRSQYEGNERWEALLRFDNHTGGLKATWTAKNDLPGGWKMNQSDAYLFIGDVDGDGKAELLVRSQYAGNERWDALLRFDSHTGGLRATWAARDELPGGWKMSTSDAYLSLGNIDDDSRTEVLVRSQYAGDERWEAVLRYDPSTGGMKVDWSTKNEIPS